MISFQESLTRTVPLAFSTWNESGVLLLWQLKMRSYKAIIDKGQMHGTMCSRGNDTLEKGTKEGKQKSEKR